MEEAVTFFNTPGCQTFSRPYHLLREPFTVVTEGYGFLFRFPIFVMDSTTQLRDLNVGHTDDRKLIWANWVLNEVQFGFAVPADVARQLASLITNEVNQCELEKCFPTTQ